MTEDDFVDSNMSSIVDVARTFCENGKNQAKTFDPQQSSQQHQEEQRNSNRDSGISSEKQKQQQQNQPKISEDMSRFLSDTMKFHQYSENQDGERNIIDYSFNVDGKILPKKSKDFVELADNWEQRKVLKVRRRSTVISSLAPTSNMQEGARGEINPTRFSDRLTPEVEIINGKEKRERSKYDIQPLNEYEARPKSNNIRLRRPSEPPRRQSNSRKNYIQPLDVLPLSRPLSRNYDHRAHSKASCNNSCNSSARCCHHTTVYQYNCPPDHYQQQQYNFKSHHPIRKQSTIEDEDDRILEKLAIAAAECKRTKRIAKSLRNFDCNNEVFSSTVSPSHYAKSSYRKTVEFGSVDSGIEEPSYKKTEIPSIVTSHTIMTLLNYDKKYDFLTNLARDLLIQRRNVRNLVAEFEVALLRRADLLKRKINRLESQLPNPYTPKYSTIKKQIEESKNNLHVCNEKAKEFEAIISRDKVTSQKLPEGNNNGGRHVHDKDYQLRLIYEVFMH
uniref:Uncharacterized protein n=1 Tax=Panagrolaimus sp. PS1159 TaxID=55785 RepID=A0AC35EYZ2_9BILA